MAEEFVSKLKEQLVCAVCTKTLFKPIDLPCKHSFCNDCLNHLVVFQEDGSGTLQCPHGCETIVKISVSDLVSSLLSTNNVTLNLIGLIGKESKETNKSLCQEERLHCDEEARKSCSVCSKKYCISCWETHTCESKTSTPVIYDERKETFDAICRKHGSLAKSICIDCDNQLLCIYCIHREHKDHYQDTIENQASVLKNRLSTEIENKIKDMHNPISYKEELKTIGKLRNNLAEELQERMIKRLTQYAVLLNQKKESMLKTFDAKTVEYEATLSKFGLLQENYKKTLSLYIEELNAKPCFEILVEKDEIMQKSGILSSLHCFVASLTDYNSKEDTIGDLYVSNFKKNEIEEEENIVELIFKKSCQTDHYLIDDDLASNLSQSIKDLELSIETSNKVFRRIETHKYVFEDVFKLINDDNNEELNGLLKYQPDTLLLTGCEKQTLIHIAAENGKIESLRLLLMNSNADNVDVTNKYGSTALLLASENGHTPCVELLLLHNADIDVTDEDGDTALIWASNSGHTPCVGLLLLHNADINVTDKDGYTALICASENGHKPCVEVLLNHNADYDVTNENGETALILASNYGHTPCVELLLLYNAAINVTDKDGDTALICASKNSHQTCVELLLQHNADINLTNCDGNTALICASINRHAPCIEMIVSHQTK